MSPGDDDMGKIMRELALARRESTQAIRSANEAMRKSQEFIQKTENEVHRLAQADITQSQTIVDLRIKMSEIDTIRKIGWGIISLLSTTFVGLGYTVIRNDEQVEMIQQSVRGHVSAAGHPQSLSIIQDTSHELHDINGTLKEWRDEKNKEIEEIKEEIKKRHRRAF